MVKIIGGEGNDELFGTNQNDLIDGNSGKDIIYGKSGSDLISTNGGDNTIKSGSGDDIIFSGYSYQGLNPGHEGFDFSPNYDLEGSSKIYAGKGDDIVYETTAKCELIDGGEGFDVLVFTNIDNQEAEYDVSNIKGFESWNINSSNILQNGTESIWPSETTFGGFNNWKFNLTHYLYDFDSVYEINLINKNVENLKSKLQINFGGKTSSDQIINASNVTSGLGIIFNKEKITSGSITYEPHEIYGSQKNKNW